MFRKGNRMKATVQVLANSTRVDYPAKDGRKANAKHTCQVIVLNEEVKVGVLNVYDNLVENITQEFDVNGVKKKLIPAGAYELEYGLTIGWDDKELKGVLKTMTPAGKGNPMLAAIAAAMDAQKAQASQPQGGK